MARRIDPATTAPLKVKDKDGLAEYGYNKRPESAHIQRSLDERAKAEYEHRRCTDPPANRTREELMLHDYVVVLLLARFVLLDLTHSCSLLHMVFCRQTTSPHRRPRTCASRLGPPDRKVRFGTKRTRPNAKPRLDFETNSAGEIRREKEVNTPAATWWRQARARRYGLPTVRGCSCCKFP